MEEEVVEALTLGTPQQNQLQLALGIKDAALFKKTIEEIQDIELEQLENVKRELEQMGDRKRELAPICLLYTSPSPRDLSTSRMPSSA